MKTKPTLYVNLHCSEGRGFFQLDLESFSAAELQFMARVFKLAESGVQFGIESSEDGRTVMRFTIGKTEAH